MSSLLSRELELCWLDGRALKKQELYRQVRLFCNPNHAGISPASLYQEEEEGSMDGVFTRIVLSDGQWLNPQDLLLPESHPHGP